MRVWLLQFTVYTGRDGCVLSLCVYQVQIMIRILSNVISWGSILAAVALAIFLFTGADAPASTIAAVFAAIVSLALMGQLPPLMIDRGKGLTSLVVGVLFLLSALASTLFISPVFVVFALFAMTGIIVSLFLVDQPPSYSRSQ